MGSLRIQEGMAIVPKGFSVIKYGRFNCKGCGRLSRKVWVESLSYKKKLCAPCLDAKGLGVITGREKGR